MYYVLSLGFEKVPRFLNNHFSVSGRYESHTNYDVIEGNFQQLLQ